RISRERPGETYYTGVQLPQKAKTLELKPDSKLYSSTLEKKKEKPVFLTQLSGAAVNTGETARFTVRVSGFPKPTVQWSHNGKVVKSSSVYKLIEEKDEYTLVITQVTSEYEGKYSCTATNRFGQTTSSQAEKWVEKMCSEGTEASFNYKVSGDPVPDIKWFKGPFQIQPSRNCTIRTNSDGSGFIIIKNVKQQDSGLYTCKASNQFGETACSAELVVFKESISASTKYTMSLIDLMATLEIANCTVEDTGDYVCVASSEAGSDHCTCTVIVKGWFSVSFNDFTSSFLGDVTIYITCLLFCCRTAIVSA
uniref:Ig-like domain-containing protein n=1 Tax=Maylandia zebra TaxID=106582 RepID=A0A3P9CRW1_9CICH